MSDFSRNSASLKLKPFERPVSAVLQEFLDRPEAIDDLMSDPTGYLMLRVSPQMASKLPRTTVNAANKFLFSAISNEPFRKWLFEYNDALIQEFDTNEFAELDDVKIRADLAQALLDHGDVALVRSLLEIPQTPVIPGVTPVGGGCCDDKDDNPFPMPDPFGPTPVPEAMAVAAVVLVVVAVSVAAVALALVLADTPIRAGLKSNRMKAFSMTGQELVSISEAIVRYSERMREAGKI